MPAAAPPRRRRQAAFALGHCHLAGGPLPQDFAAALHRRAAELHGVRVLNYLPLESLALLTDPACGDAFQIESIFYNTYQQEAQRLGRCAFLPNHLRNAARDWTHGAPEHDCLVLTVSPMDKHGCFSLAGSACIELRCSPAPGGWWWRWPPVLPGSSGT